LAAPHQGVDGACAEDGLGQVAHHIPEQRRRVQQGGQVFGLVSQAGRQTDARKVGAAGLRNVGIGGDQVLLGG
jgi:hypothetical protein